MNSEMKSLIIEDNLLTQEFITTILHEHFPEIKIIGYADSIQKALTILQKEKPELVFMDIELTDGLSFEIFDTIQQPQFEVVFITAFEHLMQKAMDHFALNYITKPIDTSKLIATVNHYKKLKKRLFSIEKFHLLKNLTQGKEGKLLIQTTNEHVLIKIADIMRCEAEGNYAMIYLQDGRKFLASKPIKYYEELLPVSSFFRAHRSTIVNINFIQSIYKKETIILTNNDKVHVSARNRSKLIELIQSLS